MELRINVDKHYPINLELLPATWAVRRLRDVLVDAQSGFSSSRHNEEGTGIPHLRPMNIDRLGRLVLNQLKYVSPDVTESRRLQVNDILFNNTNSAELVGKTALFTLEGEWAFSNHMTLLRCSEQVRPAFLSFQLLYLWTSGYFKARRKQHIGQASISLRTLLDTVPILVPPINEQRFIESLVQAALKDLEISQGVLSACEQQLSAFRISSFAAAIQGSLVPQADGEAQGAACSDSVLLPSFGAELADVPFTIPQTWQWVTTGDVGSILLGRQRAPKHHFGEHMRPYLRVANVYEDRLDLSDVQEMNFTPAEYAIYGLEAGDILLNEGQSPELVGRAAMYRGEVPGSCFQNTLLRFRAHPGVSSSYALIVFRSYLHSGRFKKAAKWSTNLAHLGRNRFSNIEFPLPPLLEQEKIVAECVDRSDTVETLLSTIEVLNTQVTALRYSFLGAAFAGLFPYSAARDQEPVVNQQADSPTPFRSHRRSMAKRTTKEAGSILDIMKRVGQPMTPEALFVERGLGEDLVDLFFAELKELHERSQIKQETNASGVVLVLHEEVLS